MEVSPSVVNVILENLPAIACKAPPKIPPVMTPVIVATGVATVRERDVVVDGLLVVAVEVVAKGNSCRLRSVCLLVVEGYS